MLLTAALALVSVPAQAQTSLDNSGNGLLNGDFDFRDVVWITDNQGNDNLVQAVAQFGTIHFDGAGNYTVNATVFDSKVGTTQSITYNGAYVIGAAGYGYIERTDAQGGWVYGGFGSNVFMGSPTESQTDGLFIATPATANMTTQTFNSGYGVAYMNFPTLTMSQSRDAGFQMFPNGAGSMPNITATGYIGGNLNAMQQSINNPAYSFANGIGTLSFGGTLTASAMLAGDIQVYASPDGEFLFGGSTLGWDMFLAVRLPTSAVPPDALNKGYYQAGVDVNRSQLDKYLPQLDTYYGSFTAVPSANAIIGHQRILVAPYSNAYDFNYGESLTINSDGVLTDLSNNQFQVSSDGRYRVGWGRGNLIGVHAGAAIPTLTAPDSKPFINPTGVLNAAAFTPFTAGLSRGEVVTIFGENLSSQTLADGTFPTTLGNTQVLVNGELAPVYVVSPTQISFVMPYDIQTIAEIQVVSGGVQSNRATFFMNTVSTGIFTVPATGIGFAAALHTDYTLVDQQKPAVPGETIAIYLTGLGDVSPAVTAGQPGPTDPFSKATASLTVSIDGLPADISYQGLAPTLGGLYQLNVKVPDGAYPGSVYIEVDGPDAYSSQAQLPISGTIAADKSGIQRPARQTDRSASRTPDRAER